MRLAHYNIRIMRYLLIIIFTVSLSCPLGATELYQIDPEHTYAVFSYSHWGLSTQSGRFDKASGTITLESEQHRGSLDIAIESNSINTGSDGFNRILRGNNFFDSEKFPVIHFQSSRFLFDGDTPKRIEGDLTIRGITKTVSIELNHFQCRFIPVYFRQACGANGVTKLLRSDFELGRYVPFVSDEVTLTIGVEALKVIEPEKKSSDQAN